MRLDLRKRDRRGQQNAALCRAADELGDGEERLAGKRRGGIDGGAAPVGEQECSAAAAATRDAVRVGERQKGTKRSGQFGGRA